MKYVKIRTFKFYIQYYNLEQYIYFSNYYILQ